VMDYKIKHAVLELECGRNDIVIAKELVPQGHYNQILHRLTIFN
jgi:hypothetical protein